MELPQIAELLFSGVSNLKNFEDINVDFVSEVALGDRNRDMHYLYTLSSYLEPLLEEEVVDIDYYLDHSGRGALDAFEYYNSFFQECVPNIDVYCSYKDGIERSSDVFDAPFPKNLFFYFPISLPESVERYSFTQEELLIHRTFRSVNAEYNGSYPDNSTRRAIGNQLFYDALSILSDYYSEFKYIGVDEDPVPDEADPFLEDDYLDLISFVRSFPLVFCELSYIHNICSTQNTPFLTFSLIKKDWTLNYAENLISDIFSRYIIFTGDGYMSPNSDYEENREKYNKVIEEIVSNQVDDLEKRFLNKSQVHSYKKRGFLEEGRFNQISFNFKDSVLETFNILRENGLFKPVLDRVFENLDNEHAPSEFCSNVEFSSSENISFVGNRLRVLLVACADYIMNSSTVNRFVRDFDRVVLKNTTTMSNQNLNKRSLDELFYINSKICSNRVKHYHFTESRNVDDVHTNLNVKWLSESSSCRDVAGYSSVFNS